MHFVSNYSLVLTQELSLLAAFQSMSWAWYTIIKGKAVHIQA